MTPAQSPLLEAREIGRRDADAGRWLFQGISIDIRPGSRTALVGPTGSGKTLLLRALARLDGVDAGEVLWRGEAISGQKVPHFRRHAIYFHQRPALVEGSVEENLRLPFSLKIHHNHEFRRDLALHLLARVERGEEFLARSAQDLSGGEAQIVTLLRGIQLEPEVLLLDEPTAALDESSAGLIERLVQEWFDAKPGERALVWVSHDGSQVPRVSDRVIRLRDGRIDPGEGNVVE